MNFKNNFSKNINVEELKGNIENSLNQTLAHEILDEEDLLNHLTPNDVLDKIQMFDSTV